MRNISILVISFIFATLSGCAVGEFPKFPDIKKQYLLLVKGEETPEYVKKYIDNINDFNLLAATVDSPIDCLEFDILSTRPYKLKLVGVVEVKNCHMVGGYKPHDTQSLLNWADDAYNWAKDRQHCFKN